MKKILILISVFSLMMACAPQPIPDCNAHTQAPIQPIRFQGSNMHLFLTDYIPVLDTASLVEISTEPSYSIVRTAPLEYDLQGDGTLSNIHVECDGQVWDIAIVPLQHAQAAMLPIAATDTTITIGLLDEFEVVQWRAYVQDELLSSNQIQHEQYGTQAIVQLPKAQASRTYLTVYAMADGQVLNDILVPLQDGKPVLTTDLLTRHDDQSQVLYSLMIDRFANGNIDNDWKMHSQDVLDIVDYQGGDIQGIADKIQSGFFTDLGVTTIWISPITQNPWDAWGRYPFPNGNKYDSTKTYTRYSGYHGYWPIYATSLEQRFSTEKELKNMLSLAHSQNMNVILDYVANHMHINSPTLQAHPNWHTDSLLPDGRRNFELWDEARLTTWFDVHIPTLDLERMDVCEPMTDSALYWIENFDFDGYRHDACKHIPECYWRMLTHKLKSRMPNRHVWMIGETYGSPELIGTYVKSGMLNAQFDFNVYFTTIHAICGDQPMADIDRVVRESMSHYGAHHTMGCISGNHDQVRFASLAGGGIHFDQDGKMEGWTRHVGLIPADTPDSLKAQVTQEALRKAMLLHMVNMTIPGVPCIYQGDEYAETGGNDPDNRHMMRFELNEQEQSFRNQVKQLIHIRRSHMAMMYGQYIPIHQDSNTIEFERRYMDQTARIVISRTGESSITINGTKLFTL